MKVFFKNIFQQSKTEIWSINLYACIMLRAGAGVGCDWFIVCHWYGNPRRERESETIILTSLLRCINDGWLLGNEIILEIFSCFHQFILIGDLNLKES